MSQKYQSAMHSLKVGKPSRSKNLECVKLKLDEHLSAYLESKTLERDNIEHLECDQDLVDKVVLNYIIVRQILSNLDWQDKILCKHVCTTWNSAVKSLQREMLAPQDFVVQFASRGVKSFRTYFRKSGNFSTEPMLVVVFSNMFGGNLSCKCEDIVPKTCKVPCKSDHAILDIIYKFTTAPKNSMISIRTDYVSYMPLIRSATSPHTLRSLKASPFLGGLYIPVIPDVSVHKINLRSNDNMLAEFFETIEKLASTRIFKGLLVLVSEKFILHSVDITFLDHFKDIQPDIPYALGGCVVEDTVIENSELTDVVDTINKNVQHLSQNLVSITAFTVPKDKPHTDSNFDMFSLILSSSEWAKPAIQHSISEFAKKVPRFEHSVAFKLSCVGRDQKHVCEHDYFRASFPNTRIVGCYGNGELGINHPAKVITAEELNALEAKRMRMYTGEDYGFMYSYSTVFVYMGWGKVYPPPAANESK